MKPSLSLSLFLPAAVSLLYLFGPISAAAEGPGSSGSAAVFIRTSCNETMYPDVCYASLRRYAAAVRQDYYRLARLAIAVSLAKARNLTYIVNAGYGQAGYGGDSRASAALRDCHSQFSDAIDEIHDSQKQMRQIGDGNATEPGRSLGLYVSNVQTWMSAALTYQGTCTDGFEGVADGPLKRQVCDGVAWATKHTSNALALINLYGRKVGATA